MNRFALLSVLVLVLVVAALSGCNATRGLGTDIADSGRHMENIGK